MKLRSCACIVALVGLGGCASMHDQAVSHAQPAVSPADSDIDSTYVAQVERKSVLHNIVVMWVNPPAKPLPQAGH